MRQPGTAVIQAYLPSHPDEHGGADDQGAGGQQLVAHAEQGPDGRDVAGIDQISPGNGEKEAGDDDARHPPFRGTWG